MRLRFAFIILFVCFTLIGKVIDVHDSMREAVDFIWQAPEKPFVMGEIIHFSVLAVDVAEDSAIAYVLDAAELTGDSVDPFLVIPPPEKYIIDTLAPGETTWYNYIIRDEPRWKYDPFKGVRSYENPVGLNCLPPGIYKIRYDRRWKLPDSLEFEIIAPDQNDRPFLDSLANIYIAYRVGRKKDAIKLSRWFANKAPDSRYTARALLFGAAVAWEDTLCADAIALDSIFWNSYGSRDLYKYLPYPNTLRYTIGIIGRCKKAPERFRYLDWISSRRKDKLLSKEIEKAKMILSN